VLVSDSVRPYPQNKELAKKLLRAWNQAKKECVGECSLWERAEKVIPPLLKAEGIEKYGHAPTHLHEWTQSGAEHCARVEVRVERYLFQNRKRIQGM